MSWGMGAQAPEERGYDVHTLRSSRGTLVNLNYLVVDRRTREAALIDASWDLDLVVAKVAETGARLGKVLLTHSHFDHVHLLPRLAETFRPQVFMARAEAEYYGFRCPGLEAFGPMEEIAIGATKALCLDTPGHTAGSACFRFSHSLFSGDTVFSEGCGLCHGTGGCPHSMFRSLRFLKRFLDGREEVFPGHSFWAKPGKPFASLLKTNPYLGQEDEDEFVRFAMRKERLKGHEAFRTI